MTYLVFELPSPTANHLTGLCFREHDRKEINQAVERRKQELQSEVQQLDGELAALSRDELAELALEIFCEHPETFVQLPDGRWDLRKEFRAKMDLLELPPNRRVN